MPRVYHRKWGGAEACWPRCSRRTLAIGAELCAICGFLYEADGSGAQGRRGLDGRWGALPSWVKKGSKALSRGT